MVVKDRDRITAVVYYTCKLSRVLENERITTGIPFVRLPYSDLQAPSKASSETAVTLPRPSTVPDVRRDAMQQEAVEKLRSHLKDEGKGLLYMACGTGKTHVVGLLAQQSYDFLVFFSPWIALNDQSHKRLSEMLGPGALAARVDCESLRDPDDVIARLDFTRPGLKRLLALTLDSAQIAEQVLKRIPPELNLKVLIVVDECHQLTKGQLLGATKDGNLNALAVHGIITGAVVKSAHLLGSSATPGRQPKKAEKWGEYNVGEWLMSRRKELRAGNLGKQKLDALVTFEREREDSGHKLEDSWRNTAVSKAVKALPFEKKIELMDKWRTENGPGRLPVWGEPAAKIEHPEGSGDMHNLSRWLSDFRVKYKAGKLTDEQAKLLGEKLPAGWISGTKAVKALPFEKKLELMVKWRTENGRLPVWGEPAAKIEYPEGSGDKHELSGWLSGWRVNCKAGKLSDEQRKLLDEILPPGWISGTKAVKGLPFEKKLELMLSWIDDNGRRLPVRGEPAAKVEHPEGSGDMHNLSTWLDNWRVKYKAGKLSDEQMKLLDETLPPGWLDGREYNRGRKPSAFNMHESGDL